MKPLTNIWKVKRNSYFFTSKSTYNNIEYVIKVKLGQTDIIIYLDAKFNYSGWDSPVDSKKVYDLIKPIPNKNLTEILTPIKLKHFL